MSFLRTKNGIEIDLILTSPRGKKIFLEIKSTKNVEEYHTKTLKSFIKDKSNEDIELLLVSNDPQRKIFAEHILCLHWKEALVEAFKLGL